MKKPNIFLVIKAIRKINKKKPKMFVYGCIEAVLEVSQSYIQLLLLPLIITSFSKGEVNSFICACALYFIIPFTSGIIAKVFCGKRVIHEIEMSEDTVNNVHNKLLKIPFNSFSNEEIKEQYEVALDELYYEFDYSDLVEKEIAIIKNILSLSFSIIFVISMVCTIPTIISNKLMFSISQPIVTTVIYAITFMLLLLLNKRVQNKAIKKHKVLLDKHAKVEKRLFYLQNEIVYDFNNYLSYGLFNMGKMLGSRFDENKKENVDFFSDIKNITIKTRSSRSLFSGLSYLFCFIITLIKTISGAIEASLFVSYMQSSSRAFEEAISLHDNYGSIKQQLHYFDNIEAVMNLQEEINEGKSITIDKKHRFQFSHVYYKYPNATDYALEDINIEFGDKDNIALVGENGSGKTTLLMLLYRLIVPEKGIITIDGIDIQTINIFEYRKLFSSMLQETDVYPFSIAENVSFSGKDKLTQIQKALEKALVSDSFSTNDSLYTYNEDRSYSGGEKQKIVAARAFYKNAPIYVFDEPTSALDAVSEYNFFNKLIEVSNEHLTIFVSHRMSSCKKCDKIVVLDKGRLLEVGNHDELIKTEGKYNELWTAQAVHYV